MSSARPSDVAFAASLHRTALPDGFFAELGPFFLRSYHRIFLRSPHAVLLIAEVDGRPAGMLAGTTDDVAHVRWCTREAWWRLAIPGLLALLLRPRLLIRFIRSRAGRYLRALVRLRRATAGPADHQPRLGEPGQAATVTHVAVLEEGRGSGAGSALIHELAARAQEAGACRLTASTRADEAGADGFYERLGWRLCGSTRDVQGREYHRWQLDL